MNLSISLPQSWNTINFLPIAFASEPGSWNKRKVHLLTNNRSYNGHPGNGSKSLGVSHEGIEYTQTSSPLNTAITANRTWNRIPKTLCRFSRCYNTLQYKPTVSFLPTHHHSIILCSHKTLCCQRKYFIQDVPSPSFHILREPKTVSCPPVHRQPTICDPHKTLRRYTNYPHCWGLPTAHFTLWQQLTLTASRPPLHCYLLICQPHKTARCYFLDFISRCVCIIQFQFFQSITISSF
jgi:hypothetical protein